MPRFFIDNSPNSSLVQLNEQDAHHITRVLRMKTGEGLTLCDSKGNDYICKIKSMEKNNVICEVLQKDLSKGEAKADVTLYMALPKGDKMDFIVQKAVELGAKRIVPFIAERSVSRPDQKTLIKKCERWRKIAREAAMQSERGVIPEVSDVLTYENAVCEASKHQFALFLYENEKNTTIRDVLFGKEISSVALMVGPEGGFAEQETSAAYKNNMQSVSLGPRILRCETAPLAAISIVMYESGGI